MEHTARFRIRKYRRRAAWFAALSLMGSVIVSVLPTAASAHDHSPASVRSGGEMSLDQAVAMVQAKYNARVMRANTVEEGGRVVHYIRLISADHSRVWTVRVDARTGREF